MASSALGSRKSSDDVGCDLQIVRGNSVPFRRGANVAIAVRKLQTAFLRRLTEIGYPRGRTSRRRSAANVMDDEEAKPMVEPGRVALHLR
jgi:hypothetical protein